MCVILFPFPFSPHPPFPSVRPSVRPSIYTQTIQTRKRQHLQQQQVMAKHKAKDGPAEHIKEFRLHWDTKGRDAKIWPEYTIVTDDNFAALLEVLRANPTMGVLEIKVGKDE